MAPAEPAAGACAVPPRCPRRADRPLRLSALSWRRWAAIEMSQHPSRTHLPLRPTPHPPPCQVLVHWAALGFPSPANEAAGNGHAAGSVAENGAGPASQGGRRVLVFDFDQVVHLLAFGGGLVPRVNTARLRSATGQRRF